MLKFVNRNDDLLVPAWAYSSAPQKNHELVNLRQLGIFPGLAGGDRGTNTEGDVLTQTLDGRSLNDIWAEFQATLGMYNEARSTLINLLTFSVSAPTENVPVVTGDDFEEASEFGEPKGLRGGDFYSIGYDFKWYDLAIRYTWKYLAEATASQVESLNNMALEADNRLLFRKVMEAIFDNRTRVADIRQSAVNVYPFYNGDMDAPPPRYKNNTFTSDENHYMTSGSTVVDSGDLDDLAKNITEHGYGTGPGGQLLLLANEQEIATMRGFRVANGDSYDFIPSAGSAPFLTPQTAGVQGGQPPAQYNGLDVAGRYGKFLVIEESYIPAGYLVGIATGGEVTPTNPVGIREHQNAGLRGLRLVKGRDNDYPLVDSFYQRGFGTGIRHRGAGAVMQITEAAEYERPADYTRA